MMQREVAERVTAAPGSRRYGYLSVLSQLHAQPRIVLKLPPGVFSPPPEVHSALVSFEITQPAIHSAKLRKGFARETGSPEEDEEKFLALVKLCWPSHRNGRRTP